MSALAEWDQEKIEETAMVDIAYELLSSSGEPKYYRDLLDEVAKIKGFDEEQINAIIAQLYTDINIDGRFLCVGQNLWGLKAWYSMEVADNSNMGHFAFDDDDDLDAEVDEEIINDEELEDDEEILAYDSNEDEPYDDDEDPDLDVEDEGDFDSDEDEELS